MLHLLAVSGAENFSIHFAHLLQCDTFTAHNDQSIERSCLQMFCDFNQVKMETRGKRQNIEVYNIMSLNNFYFLMANFVIKITRNYV